MGHSGEFWQNVIHSRREWQTTSVYSPWGPHELYKKAKNTCRLLVSDLGFPDSSIGKECTHNAGDPSWIPGSGRSFGEGIGYPLQCSWDSLVAQLVKNSSAMRENWVWSLGWKDSPGEGKGYALQYSGLENSMDTLWGHKELDMTEPLSPSFFQSVIWDRRQDGNCFTTDPDFKMTEFLSQ